VIVDQPNVGARWKFNHYRPLGDIETAGAIRCIGVQRKPDLSRPAGCDAYSLVVDTERTIAVEDAFVRDGRIPKTVCDDCALQLRIIARA
jgi:hypothetical protein